MDQKKRIHVRVLSHLDRLPGPNPNLIAPQHPYCFYGSEPRYVCVIRVAAFYPVNNDYAEHT